MKYKIIAVNPSGEDGQQFANNLAKYLSEGWKIERADSTGTFIIYILSKDTP